MEVLGYFIALVICTFAVGGVHFLWFHKCPEVKAPEPSTPDPPEDPPPTPRPESRPLEFIGPFVIEFHPRGDKQPWGIYSLHRIVDKPDDTSLIFWCDTLEQARRLCEALIPYEQERLDNIGQVRKES